MFGVVEKAWRAGDLAIGSPDTHPAMNWHCPNRALDRVSPPTNPASTRGDIRLARVVAGRLVARLAVPIGFLFGLGAGPVARAHDVLMTFVRHDTQVVVGPTNIDITVALTFHEIASLEEREHMDRNRDGQIDRREIAAYLASLEPTLARALELTVDGKPAEVLVLHNPQLDLLESEKVFPAHHVLRLFYFARTPASLAAGNDLVLRDRLWVRAPTLRFLRAAGAGGIQVETDSKNEVLSDPDSKGEGGSMRIKCLETPPRPPLPTVGN